eukprot:CAMPEP_0182862494 /NCGR_PEP_ID=MMETSP0034_2-20130328/6101_1 /TAXON_ID=156128 /ORGANISM="Nephroselmis pyriformis, Strain CCMP717" /LENGTH=97 /DNA_ID=CAMNT_0024994567 /DNA_START=42 /DNA_END=336 /DNA_ORIENTATION=-
MPASIVSVMRMAMVEAASICSLEGIDPESFLLSWQVSWVRKSGYLRLLALDPAPLTLEEGTHPQHCQTLNPNILLIYSAYEGGAAIEKLGVADLNPN